MRAAVKTRGFSLIEIMAVMVILGVVLMSVVPALDGLVPTYRLKGGARELASAMELAQSEAVGARKQYELAYDLDANTYWLILPPKPREGSTDEPTPEEAAAKAAMRPEDDVEHGLPPADPNDPQEDADAQSDAEREMLTPKPLPDGVVFDIVVVGDDEKSSGQVRVPFSYLGSDGTHVVGLKLENGEAADQLWIKFNAITRTIEYTDERPQAKTVSGEGS
jgi:prepilin-type N-terminal cleavage/methylation domain-containing protein